ncbi:hypothetical protein [Microlunatus parietis]|uniref:Secreted protein n=1 Tax=Microlunatus parietis TaxID=682979 RepID=A0A7Y9LBF4_9ACTN|nr:hypothetical protein [Microlunatus parietis]NYE73769.1 hypothetical protein [Microlunatus parietis]
MRGFLIRLVVAVTVTVAALVPSLAGTAQAIPAVVHTKCAPWLVINGHRVATCGQTQGSQGRHGTYDVASRTYTWGPWRPQSSYRLPTSPYFAGYPALVDGSGRTFIYGTEFRASRRADGRYEGRRGILRSSGFVPTSSWYASTCQPPLWCWQPDLQHEPIPPPPPKR